MVKDGEQVPIGQVGTRWWLASEVSRNSSGMGRGGVGENKVGR